MLTSIRPAFSVLTAMTILTGMIYPGAITLIGQFVFPHQTNGSFIRKGDQTSGSELIGQAFANPEYFWGRLSATAPFPYNATASSGSNVGPSNPALIDAVKVRLEALGKVSSLVSSVPVDLVTASASGLDPHISPAAAEFQVPRIAKSRNLSEDSLRALIQKHTIGRQFGLLGEPHVNVLLLNLSMDESLSTE